MRINSKEDENSACHLEDLRKSSLIDLSAADRESAIPILAKMALFGETIAKNENLGGTTKQRQFGIYYTNFELARALVDDAIRLKGTSDGTFFEPCAGGGAFLFAFVEAVLDSRNPSKSEVEGVLSRCYVADNDPVAIENLKKLVPNYMNARFGHYVSLPDENIFLGDSLFVTTDAGVALRDFESTFGVSKKFDFIVTNPPYLLLKKDSRLGSESSATTNSIVATIQNSNAFPLSEGTKNLYKIFTEAILDKWLAEDGVAGLLIPRSLLTDNQSTKLRKYLLSNFKLGTIVSLKEGTQEFKSVGQAFSAFAALKNSRTDEVVFGEFEKSPPKFHEATRTSLAELSDLIPNDALHQLNVGDIKKLKTLSKYSTISKSQELMNLRGEFDMSLDKNLLSQEDTGLRLIQGSHLGMFSFTEPTKFVSQDILTKPKGKWILRHRIACQQISNMNSERRLKWALIPQVTFLLIPVTL